MNNKRLTLVGRLCFGWHRYRRGNRSSGRSSSQARAHASRAHDLPNECDGTMAPCAIRGSSLACDNSLQIPAVIDLPQGASSFLIPGRLLHGNSWSLVPCSSSVLLSVMALKSTIFKAELSVADIDRGYYHDHVLMIARHPSETDERMMVRLLAFALHADGALTFGRGLSTEDEPDVWRRDLTGAIDQWIDVGLPDEREVRKACGRAREVYVLAYGGRAVDLWWQNAREKLERQDRLAVTEVPIEASRALAQLANRSMRLQLTIEDGHVLVADGATSVALELRILKARSAGR